MKILLSFRLCKHFDLKVGVHKIVYVKKQFYELISIVIIAPIVYFMLTYANLLA